MLLGEGDFELNLLQGFDTSLQNVVVQTVVGQDKIFRNQVAELHRLYHIQKILMQEMDQKDSNQFHSREECQYSFVSPFKIQICMPRHMKDNFLQDQANTCLKHERGPNLELLANFNTNLRGDVLYEKCERFTTEPFVQMKCDFDSVKASPTEELELSLSINSGTRKTCFVEKSWEGQMKPKNYDGDLVTTTLLEYSTFSDYKPNLERSSCTRSRKNDGFCQGTRINSLTDLRTKFLEKRPAIQGVEQCHDDITCKAKSTRRKLFTSPEVVDLDLNRPLSEELPFNSIDHLTFYSSRCTFSILNRHEQVVKCSNDSSNSDQREMMDSTLTTSRSKYTSEVNHASAFGSVELPSICGPPSKSRKASHCAKNTAFQLNLPHRSSQTISWNEVNAEKPHESSLELAEEAGSKKLPISSKSDLIPEGISSNIKNGQCGVDTERSPTTFQDKILRKQKIIPSNEPKRKFQSSNWKDDQMSEVDILIKTGAVSLLYLSSAFSAKNQNYIPCSIGRREMSNATRDVPQCSSESYESIVLKQAEISLEEYSMTSIPSLVNCSNEKDYGPKLKRGRRMKDFRKEILPGLASLSRQEICEDVRIMRGAMKSLEHKCRSKTRRINDGFSPLKSKGSINNNGRRRCYS